MGAALGRRRWPWFAVLAGAVMVLGILVGKGSLGSAQAAGNSGTVAGAATVQRRDLVETDTESGTLSYANPQTVYNRLSGTVTWLPSVGQVIHPGGTLYKVDNAPVVLFDGTTPAYRDLTSGDTAGPDILELNRNLVKLGFADGEITINDTWQTGTTDAVERWQGSHGETETGTITLGEVVFLPGDQRITDVDSVLGSTGGSSDGSGSGSGSGGANAALEDVAPHPEFVSLTTHPGSSTIAGSAESGGATDHAGAGSQNPDSASGHGGGESCPKSIAEAWQIQGNSSACNMRNLSAEELAALIALLKAETKEHGQSGSGGSGGGGAVGGGGGGAGGGAVGNSGGGGAGGGGGAVGNSGGGGGGGGSGGSGGSAGSAGSGGSGGSGGSNAEAILDTSSTQLVVTVDLDATKQSEAVVGEPVTVEMPAGNTVNGKITQVSPVAQNNNSGNGSGSGSGNGSGSGSGNNGSSSGATIPVTVTLAGHQTGSGLDQAAVSVNFAQQKANNVLSVPVTALLATAGANYEVQEAAPPHALLPVTVGLFAAGYVEISGPGIYPGLQVTDSQG
jgi:hypothetical protein